MSNKLINPIKKMDNEFSLSFEDFNIKAIQNKFRYLKQLNKRKKNPILY